MLIDKTEITNYLPQRPPFVMLDKIIEANENRIVGEFTIDSPVLAREGYVSHGVLMESLAQTCAAGFGIQAKSKEEQGKLGFIGAISKLKVNGDVRNGDTIKTHIRLITSFDQVQLVEGKVSCNDREVLECQMKIVTP